MRNTILSCVVALTAITGATTAQQASVQITGTSCTTPEGAPLMGHFGTAVLGGAFELLYGGPNHEPNSTQSSSQPHLVIGFSFIGPVTIPQSLLIAQPAGCELLPAHDIVVPMLSAGRGGYATGQRFPVPNDPAMLGAVFFGQWLTVHIQCGFAGCGPLPEWIATSETAICTVGT
jgi:hypothetical protein